MARGDVARRGGEVDRRGERETKCEKNRESVARVRVEADVGLWRVGAGGAAGRGAEQVGRGEGPGGEEEHRHPGLPALSFPLFHSLALSHAHLHTYTHAHSTV
eukprot:2751522-Rhodomonas_salina.1